MRRRIGMGNRDKYKERSDSVVMLLGVVGKWEDEKEEEDEDK